MKTIKKTIAIDSNALTYFVDAIEIEYDPNTDDPDLSEQRIAMLRIFFYGGESYYIVPTVIDEYKRITNDEKRSLHEDVHNMIMIDFVWDLDDDELKDRTQHYHKYHNNIKDCRILAESELGDIDTLLSYDRKFIERIRNNTIRTKVMQPSDYYESLNIMPGSRPVWSPSKSNPLSKKTWWKI